MVEVSIIVPIYNVERYLNRAIDSIIKQTFTDYEIILINDGSTDNSFSIAQEYVEKYPERIRLITQKNAGLSAARNRGIDEALGEYVCFIDSDDFIKPDMIERLYNQISSKKADMAICGVTKYIEETGYTYEDTRDYDEDKVFDSEYCIRQFLLDQQVDGYACNKLFKKSLFTENNIRFPMGKMFEDAETTIKLILACKGIVFSDCYSYNYVQRNGSITKDVNPATIEHFVRSFETVKQILDKSGIIDKVKEEYKRFFINRLNVAFVMLYNYEFNHKKRPENIYNELIKLSKRVKIKEVRLKNLSRNDKSKIIFMKFGIFKTVLLFKNKIHQEK